MTDESGNVNNSISVQEPQKVEREAPVEELVKKSSIYEAVTEPSKDESTKEIQKGDDDVDDKPSLRSTTRSEAPSDNTASSSDVTVVETSPLLKNQSTTNHQAATYESINAQNHDRASVAANTTGVTSNGLDGTRSPAVGNAKGKSEFRSILKKLFCFCSSK